MRGAAEILQDPGRIEKECKQENRLVSQGRRARSTRPGAEEPQRQRIAAKSGQAPDPSPFSPRTAAFLQRAHSEDPQIDYSYCLHCLHQ